MTVSSFKKTKIRGTSWMTKCFVATGPKINLYTDYYLTLS